MRPIDKVNAQARAAELRLKLGEQICRDSALVNHVVDAYASGAYSLEDTLILLVRLLAIESERHRLLLTQVLLRAPVPIKLPDLPPFSYEKATEGLRAMPPRAPGTPEARTVTETDEWGRKRVVGGFGDVGPLPKPENMNGFADQFPGSDYPLCAHCNDEGCDRCAKKYGS